jgi:ketosteroid isomerase-like protein
VTDGTAEGSGIMIDGATEQAAIGIARRFFAAIEAGDLEALAALYAPDMTIWHNIYQIEMSGQQHIDRMRAGFLPRYRNRRYSDIRLILTPEGFVQRHVFNAELESGETVRIPSCLICDVRDGQIVRIEEYLTMSPDMVTGAAS